MNQEIPQESIKRLRDVVQKHRVCYQVWPEYMIVGGEKVQVGFDLELCGTHEHTDTKDLPECAQCYQTYKDLREIAEWIAPNGEGAARHEIQPFDRAFHETSTRGFRPEVILSIKILHRYDHRFDRPVDQTEELCLKEMQRKLAQIGVSEGDWTSRKSR